MKNIIIIAFSLVLNTMNAQEYNNHHLAYIEIGYSGGVYSQAPALGMYGGAGVFFKTGTKQSAVDIRAKELYLGYPQREAAAITLTYRLYLDKGFYVGGGFAHNHEIDADHYLEDPMGSTMGNGKFIIHRTGLALESGYDFKSFPRDKWFGVYPVIGLTCSYMLADHEPNPLVMMNFGFKFGGKNTRKS